MTITSWFRRKKVVLRGNVCTIRLQVLSSDAEGAGQVTDLLPSDLLGTIEPALSKSIPDSLGPDFRISDIAFHKSGAEILVKIWTDCTEIDTYEQFSTGIGLLVSHLQSLLAWLLGSYAGPIVILGQWSPEPPLIHLRLQTQEPRNEFLKQLQQPLSLLVLGTVLGSLLVPYLNDVSNRRKVRHEERIKMALSIVEQNQETDQRLFNLMEYLVLFRKDHNDPLETRADLKLQQIAAKKAFNEMYLSFNGQAWWWYWSIRSKSSLSALATKEESQKIGQFAQEYGAALSECTDPIAKVWDRLLKHPYKPRDPENDRLITQAREALKKARTRRDQAAIQMAQLLTDE